ncbi:OBP3-responsive gene 4 [Zea mays]|uniref:OBP3-responsive gene 4 n=1 Tax=Zea mays TaxID=4577 RepID=A0A1D6E9R5_MAIZE|nr:OBP3-responsive gene 4 [Zea mays]
MASSSASGAGVEGGVGEGPTTLDELYQINVVPAELHFKFRKELQGLRVGLNLEFYNLEVNDFEAKIVLKPLDYERKWKFQYKPISGDIQLLSKKIPVTKFLNLQVIFLLQHPVSCNSVSFVLGKPQVGIGHNFQLNATGWKWKLSTCLGGDGVSQIRNKSKLSLFPGFDLRIGWKAEYVLPEIHGAVGTGEPAFSMNYGRLHASIDRVEAIVTQSDQY